jgi:hypothetical protein
MYEQAREFGMRAANETLAHHDLEEAKILFAGVLANLDDLSSAAKAPTYFLNAEHGEFHASEASAKKSQRQRRANHDDANNRR